MIGADGLHALFHARADEAGVARAVERLRGDRRFRDEMAVAKVYGIPHSRLIDEWDEDDIDAAIAYERFLGGICPECGIHHDDWPTDEDDPPFEVHAYRCHGCAAIAAWWRPQRDREDSELAGVKAVLRRVMPEYLTDMTAWAEALDPDRMPTRIGW